MKCRCEIEDAGLEWEGLSICLHHATFAPGCRRERQLDVDPYHTLTVKGLAHINNFVSVTAPDHETGGSELFVCEFLAQ
jgi:hypothetical protein